MKKRIGFFITLIFAVLLITASIVPSVIGATSSRSGLSVIVEFGMGLVMNGPKPVSEEATDEKIENRRIANAKYKVPSVYKGLFSMTVKEHEGFQVCYFGKETEKKIIYFHGGSFMWQPLHFHYDFCSLLYQELGLQVVMPVYPKAPEYKAEFTLEWLRSLLATIEGDDIYMGDSSGGAMLLSTAQYLIDVGEDTADTLIAISPVMDITLSNEEMSLYEQKEVMINRADTARKMKVYAGDIPYDSPYVSPIYCDYTVMPKTIVIASDKELMYPDIKLWDTQMTELGVDHTAAIFPNQNHVFAIYPIPERTLAMKVIKKELGM